MDCNLHYQRTRGRSIVGLHLYRLFRRYVVSLNVPQKYNGVLLRPHVRPCCPSMGEQKSAQSKNYTCLLANIHLYQVGERRVVFIYALLAIAYVALPLFIHTPSSN